MKKFYKSNTFLAVISIIAAVSIWIYVVYEVNPMYEKWVNDIPVRCINTSSLFDDGSMIITGENSNLLNGSFTIDVKIKGKRNIVSSVNKSNLNCTLNLVTVSKKGEYSLKPEIDTEISGVEFIKINPHNIKLTVEEVNQKDLKIEIEKRGNIKEGYTLENLENKNETVKITGPDSIVNRVKSAKIVLDTDTLEVTDTERSCPIMFFDENGDEVSASSFGKTVEYARLTFNFHTEREVSIILMPKSKNDLNKNKNGDVVTLKIAGNGALTDDGGIMLKVRLSGTVTELEKYSGTQRQVYTEEIDVSEVYSDTTFKNIKAAEPPNNVVFEQIPQVDVKAEVDKG